MKQSFQIQRRGRRVLVVLGGELAAAHSSEAAHEVARALRAAAEKAVLVPGVETTPAAVTTGRFRTTVRCDGHELILIFEPSRHLVKWPIAEWTKISEALHAQAVRVEEWEKAEQIARDHAIMLRAGTGLGLTDHPVIQDEAKKLAVDDRDIRRFMPGGVRAREQFGVPKVAIQRSEP